MSDNNGAVAEATDKAADELDHSADEKPSEGDQAGKEFEAAKAKEAAGGSSDKIETSKDVAKDALKNIEKKWKLKNKDAEIEVDEKELVRRAQLGMEAEKSISEGRKWKRDAETLIRLIKEDPVAVLSHPHIGHDVKALAEKVLLEQIKLEAMSPDQRAAHEATQKLRALEAEKKEAEEAAASKKREALEQHWAGEYQKQIIGALNKSGLPKTPFTVKRIAGYMHDALARGIKVTADDVVPLVMEDYMNEQKALFGAATEDTIAALLNPDLSEKFRKALLKKLKDGEVETVPADEQPAAGGEKPEKRKMTKEEFWADIDKRVSR